MAVSLSVAFRSAGRYRELLDDGFRRANGGPSLEVVTAAAGEFQSVSVPSNYGQLVITV